MSPTSVTMTHPSETSAAAERKPRDDEIDVYGLTHPGRVREENQDRETYLEGYLRFMREEWTAVPREQLEEACAHVRDYDYPEPLSTLREMARGAGLPHVQLIGRHAQHHALLFARSAIR